MQMLTTKMKELRRLKGLDQATLANMVGCRRETIGKLENGKYNPSLKLAMDIAAILEKPVEEIFFFSED